MKKPCLDINYDMTLNIIPMDLINVIYNISKHFGRLKNDHWSYGLKKQVWLNILNQNCLRNTMF